MPSPADLLAADPQSQQRAASARVEAIERIKAMLPLLRTR
jgi:hypothetical protein